MACFLIPAAEAIAVTIAAKVIEKKEKKLNQVDPSQIEGNGEEIAVAENTSKIPFSRKLKWLRNMLWGGVILLAFEHIWHGEVVPWFPFLTAAGNPADAAEMLREMFTVGVVMAVLVTGVWLIILGVVSLFEKKSQKRSKAAE